MYQQVDYLASWWFRTFVIVTHVWGKIPILTNIFQTQTSWGWLTRLLSDKDKISIPSHLPATESRWQMAQACDEMIHPDNRK